MLDPIMKFWILIFSWKIIIENNIANGIFKLFIIAKTEELTWIAPLFQRKNPIPVGISARYKIDKTWFNAIEWIIWKLLFAMVNGKTKRVAPK